MNATTKGLIRHALTVLGGAVVSRGYIDADAYQSLIGGVLTISGVLWSMHEKREAKEAKEFIEKVDAIKPDKTISYKEFEQAKDPVYDINEPSGFILSDRSRKALEGVDPLLKKVTETALELTKIDFAVTEGRRTEARQEELLAAGKSWVKRSKHQDGNAIDVAAFPVSIAEASWDMEDYKEINKAFQKAGEIHGARITWGGNWKQRDGVHFQLDGEVAKTTSIA